MPWFDVVSVPEGVGCVFPTLGMMHATGAANLGTTGRGEEGVEGGAGGEGSWLGGGDRVDTGDEKGKKL